MGETEFWSVLFPMRVKPLFAEGREPMLHLQLAPKSHFDNCVTLDEEVYRDLKGLKMALMEFFSKHGATQTVFLETAFADPSMGASHALIDAVGVPEIDRSENEEDALGGCDFSALEPFFRQALTEVGKEEKTLKKIVDTKQHRGNISKCMPNKGSFSYVHVDINGDGGFAHVIEDEAKFGRNRALQALSEGPLGNVLTNLKVPLRSEHSKRMIKQIREKLPKFLTKE